MPEKKTKICNYCRIETIFNGSQEICPKCLSIYEHSAKEVIEELERRKYAESYLPEMPD